MELQQFLEQSPLAKKVKLESRVVIYRTRLSHNQICDIHRRGDMGLINSREMVCELVIAGKVLARGKVIKWGGDYFFKIINMDVKESSP